MFTEIDTVFFDIGSTLVDEHRSDECRIREISKKSGSDYGECLNRIKSFFAENKNGYHSLVKELNVELPVWHSEYEILYPDAEECLKILSAKYQIGIIANQPKGTKERLDKFGILKYISVIAASAEEGISKPDLRLFEIAVKKAGTSPARSVMIGDRLDNDIIPAKALGMKTIWIKQGFGGCSLIRCDAEKPDYIVCNLSEVKGILTSKHCLDTVS